MNAACHDSLDSQDAQSLSERLPYSIAFPHALGTGIIVQSAHAITADVQQHMRSCIETCEHTLSRFRRDSLVTSMVHEAGRFTFPEWAAPLFDYYDVLAQATQGRVDPCIGADLVRLGYSMTFDSLPSEPTTRTGIKAASETMPILKSSHYIRAQWQQDIQREHTTLITSKPLQLDFGACAKGYCVDLLAEILQDALSNTSFIIDAGGDMRIHTCDMPVTIALEDPYNTSYAVGIAHIADGAFCASAPSRKHWSDAQGHHIHHLLDAHTGEPANTIAASWCTTDFRGAHRNINSNIIPSNADYMQFPTMIADGIATALFTTSADYLRAAVPFECAFLNTDRRAWASQHFPGTLFH